MDINQLQYVIEIAQTGSITQAAKNLYMGQPNLSKSIKDLESEIGITIFTRTAKGVILTKSGKDFVGYARSIVKQMNTLQNMYNTDTEEKIKLNIYVPHASYISNAFVKFANGLSDTEIDLSFHETNTLYAINEVSNGNNGFGIIRFQTQHKSYFEKLCLEKDLKCEHLWTYNMVVLMGKSHPLCNIPEIPYHLLSQYTEIVQSDFNPVISEEISDTKKAEPKRKISVFDRGSEFDILKNVKGSYMWVSPIPFSVLHDNGLIQKPCYNINDYCDIIIFPVHNNISPVALDLINHIKMEISQFKDIIY